ncbi:hypothetical protein ACIP6X_28045 [Streptomyces coeruleorubidus]
MAERSDSQQDVTYRVPVGSVDLKAGIALPPHSSDTRTMPLTATAA